MTPPTSRSRRCERGALTPAVIVMAIGLLLLGGLVTDGGRQLNGKLKAQGVAEEGARAGANMLNFMSSSDPRVDTPAVIDEEKALAAADNFCGQVMASDDTVHYCHAEDFGYDDATKAEWVEVRVEVVQPALLFGIIGVNDLTSSATARAAAVEGVTDPGDDPLAKHYEPSVSYPSIPIKQNDVPETSGPNPTSQVPVPTDYTQSMCNTVTVVPVTIGVTCYTTATTFQTPITTITKEKPPPPTTVTKSTKTTENTTEWSTYPTTIDPWDPPTR